MLKNNDRVKVIRECLIKHFTFYYNSACRVHKDAKYGTRWWPQKPELNHTKATKELDNKQDRIYYGIDIYSSSISPELVIYLIKEVNKTVSDNKTF